MAFPNEEFNNFVVGGEDGIVYSGMFILIKILYVFLFTVFTAIQRKDGIFNLLVELS